MEPMIECTLHMVSEDADDEMIKVLERRPGQRGRKPGKSNDPETRKLSPERVREIYTAERPYSNRIRRGLRQNTIACILNHCTYQDVTKNLKRHGE